MHERLSSNNPFQDGISLCGRTPREGFKLEKVFTEDEVLLLIEKVVTLFKNDGRPRQRLAFLIDEIGKDKFVHEVLRL